MSGIYGEMLAAFPEQFIDVYYYIRKPKVGAGYEEKEAGVTTGILQTEKSMALSSEKNMGDDGRFIEYKDENFLWVQDPTPLENGYFIKTDQSEYLYRLTGKKEWEYYGGFIKFSLEIVQGVTGEDDEEDVVMQEGRF